MYMFDYNYNNCTFVYNYTKRPNFLLLLFSYNGLWIQIAFNVFWTSDLICTKCEVF